MFETSNTIWRKCDVILANRTREDADLSEPQTEGRLVLRLDVIDEALLTEGVQTWKCARDRVLLQADGTLRQKRSIQRW